MERGGQPQGGSGREGEYGGAGNGMRWRCGQTGEGIGTGTGKDSGPVAGVGGGSGSGTDTLAGW